MIAAHSLCADPRLSNSASFWATRGDGVYDPITTPTRAQATAFLGASSASLHRRVRQFEYRAMVKYRLSNGRSAHWSMLSGEDGLAVATRARSNR